MATKYLVTEDTQKDIVKLIQSDEQAFLECEQFIEGKHLDLRNTTFNSIVDTIKEYYSKFKKLPTLTEISDLFRDKDGNIPDEVNNALTELTDRPILNRDYLIDTIKKFGKYQILYEACYKSVQELKAYNPDTSPDLIIKTLSDAAITCMATGGLGVSLDENLKERLESYATEEDVIERITTGDMFIDNLLNGGLGKTELGVVVAPPGRGKTTSLICLGTSALLHNYNVLHVSLENNESQILRNYDSAILKVVKHELKLAGVELFEKYVKILDSIRSKMMIKKYPTKSITVSSIRSLLKEYETKKKFVPDLLIVDYAALLKSYKPFLDKRSAIESNFEELRALADEFNLAIWTAAQGNRGALAKRIVSMEDLAECFAIANIVDVMMCISQTLDEKTNNKLRLFFPKIRDNADSKLLSGTIDYGIKQITMVEELGNIDFEEEMTANKCTSSNRKYSKKNLNKHNKPEATQWEDEFK